MVFYVANPSDANPSTDAETLTGLLKEVCATVSFFFFFSFLTKHKIYIWDGWSCFAYLLIIQHLFAVYDDDLKDDYNEYDDDVAPNCCMIIMMM